MATSGTNTFNLDVDQVIEEAFERCGINSRSGYDLKSARRSLNIMLAEWANRGLNLWTIQKQEKTLATNTTALTGTNLFGSGADDSQQIVDITDVIQVTMITLQQVLVVLHIGTTLLKRPADDQLNTILNVR